MGTQKNSLEVGNWEAPARDVDCLTVITARGGSKGLPGKNIRLLADKPLIAWSIEAALNAKLAQHVVVSTDDERIAEIARQYGAQVPFMRPEQLSNDAASSESVVLHALNFFARKGYTFKLILLLQPTSPLRSATDIDAAHVYMRENGMSSCVSACENSFSPYHCYLIEQKTLVPLLPKPPSARRQDLPKTYRTNGALYFIETQRFLREQQFILDDTGAFIMPEERSVDIDTEADFLAAEKYILSGKCS